MDERLKKLSFTLLLLTLLLGACSSGNIATGSSVTPKPALTKVAVTASATITPRATETVVPAREAIISEIENNVSARTLSKK